MADLVPLGFESLVIGAGVFIVSFLVLLVLWSALIRALFSFLGRSKFYFIPKTLKELFLSVALIFLLVSAYVAVLFTDRELLTNELFKIWEILIIFAAANITVRIVLTGLDVQHRQAKDRSGVYRSVGLLKGTVGLVLYLIAFIVSINVLSTEVGAVVTAIGLFVVVLLFVATFDQVKSIMAGFQLGDYYIDAGNLITIDGHTGFIDSVHGRSTIIRTFDGRMVVVPNYRFFSETFTLNKDHFAEITVLAEISGKNGTKMKEKISGISSKITMDMKEMPSEYKPQVFHYGVREGRHLYSVTFKVMQDSDVRKIMDSFCTGLSAEFKDALTSVKLEMS
jgi:small-conductance mechanosensitive channel